MRIKDSMVWLFSAFVLSCTHSSDVRLKGRVYSVDADELPSIADAHTLKSAPNGDPLPNALVTVDTCGGSWKTSTGADGSFAMELGDVPSGRDCDVILVDEPGHYGLKVRNAKVAQDPLGRHELVVELPRTVCPKVPATE